MKPAPATSLLVYVYHCLFPCSVSLPPQEGFLWRRGSEACPGTPPLGIYQHSLPPMVRQMVVEWRFRALNAHDACKPVHKLRR
ncbi:hypothetical protein F4775DRAFT_542807 [Biscogniauxia sp. FL1348]|nr:hypothetical protein F4775DRAFT_542807 [Biscogniauxia sp. FL1348]